MNIYGKVLANNLKLYREKSNLTQNDLAERANVSVRGYGKIERCEVIPSLKTIEALATAVETTPDKLLSTSFSQGVNR